MGGWGWVGVSRFGSFEFSKQKNGIAEVEFSISIRPRGLYGQSNIMGMLLGM